MHFDPYEVLNLPRDAGDDDIKKAYRQQAMKYHPDRNPGDHQAEEKFKEVGRAYDILSDPGKRSMFDRYGTVDGRSGPQGGNPFAGFDMEDALRAFMENFGFGGFSGGERENRGDDLTVSIELTLPEAVQGGDRLLKVERLEACGTCGGTGADPQEGMQTCLQCQGQGRVVSHRRTLLGTFRSVSRCQVCRGSGRVPRKPCSKCRGRGVVKKTRSISVQLPPGLSEGHCLTLRGQGHHPGESGAPGNLRVLIREVDYRGFIREGDDLVYRLQVSYPEAVSGASLRVPDPCGGEPLEVKVPDGSSTGDRIPLRGKGLGRLDRRGRGDVLVHVDIFVPRKPGRRERKLLEEMASLDGFTPPGR
jgi:molecular chaperone DnaJ